jgi:mono/diheme cytochrome c family protein
MMKSTQWLRVVMTSLVSLSAIAGCGGEEPGPGGGSGGSGGGGGTGTGTPGVTKVAPIDGYTGYVVLSDADAPAHTAPAPAKYTSAGCTSCHQAKGQGFSQIAPEVRHVPAAFAAFVIRNGRKDSKGMQTPMTAFPAVAAMPTDPALTDAEIMEVVTWLNGAPKPTTPDGLYKDFCGNCHGPTGASGGSVGIKLEGVAAAAVDAVVRAGKGTDMANRTQYMPAFDATLLTEAELGMIKTFIGAK